jgi:uncharacterized protein (DUF3084 family)
MTDSDDVKRVVAETIALYFLQAAFVELADAFARIDADGALAALDAITGSSVAQRRRRPMSSSARQSRARGNEWSMPESPADHAPHKSS